MDVHIPTLHLIKNAYSQVIANPQPVGKISQFRWVMRFAAATLRGGNASSTVLQASQLAAYLHLCSL